MEEMNKWISNPDQIPGLIIKYGGQFLLAIITLIIGLWLISRLMRGIKKVFQARKYDQTLQSFLLSLTGITLKAMLIISVVAMLGVKMTSFIAVLGAAGLAIGMALSGSLQNFAGGVMLLIFKPFKVGDYITTQGHSGIVKEIQIFHTILNTLDRKTIILPNGALSTNPMTNFSTEPQRRIDFTFGISYGEDIDKAKNVITKIIEKDKRILQSPPPFIGVVNLGESSVDLTTRVWANTPDYWDIFFAMQENVKKEFDSQGISIPFPQRDVHMFQGK
jgi:small conductance mechanosensitive channel